MDEKGSIGDATRCATTEQQPLKGPCKWSGTCLLNADPKSDEPKWHIAGKMDRMIAILNSTEEVQRIASPTVFATVMAVAGPSPSDKCCWETTVPNFDFSGALLARHRFVLRFHLFPPALLCFLSNRSLVQVCLDSMAATMTPNLVTNTPLPRKLRQTGVNQSVDQVVAQGE